MFAKQKVKLEDVIKHLRDLEAIQKTCICKDGSDYTVGFYNGLELALSYAEGRDPNFMIVDTEEAQVIETEEEKEIKRTCAGGMIKRKE